MNARLTLAYVGTRYAGWQRQPNALAVQQVLEEALEELVGEPVVTVGAGRTDAGVHASGQVVSLRIERTLPPSALVHGTNRRLPDDVRVLAATEAPEGFDARRSACAKHYLYRIRLDSIPPPEHAPFALAEKHPLDRAALDDAARLLVGEHDFEAFALAGRVPGPTRRRVFAAGWSRRGEELAFRIVGEGFLRGMVRSLVGTLLEIGRGSRPPEQLAELLEGGPRGAAGATAPARGLWLERVDYAPPVALGGAPGLR